LKILGLPVPFTARESKALTQVPESGRGGWQRIYESFTGAWQRNIVVDREQVLAHHAVFACMTLIASDIAKLRVKLVSQDDDGVWTEVENPAYSPVLRRPNAYQNRIQFWENWMLSKLGRGNTYALKQRDSRGVVNALYILDPDRTKPLVSDNGAIFYQLRADNLSGIIGKNVVVPAREIIHDRVNCLFHPLVGISPLFANGLTASQGLNIQRYYTRMFQNNANPGGVLSAPAHIPEDTAKRLKDYWEQNYSGDNAGRVAVLGDGLKFERLASTAVEGQVIDQLKWSAQVVCSTFHVPPYKVGADSMPTYNNIQALNVEYYSQCLQSYIEAAELCLDEGLEIAKGMGTEFDLDGLLRMDSVTQITTIRDAVGAGVMSPNEGRAKLDLKKAKGGESPMIQQQNYSLAALAKRDAQDDPFASKTPAVSALPPPKVDEPQPTPGGKNLLAAFIAQKQIARTSAHAG
jgi:HK97 family phage portal protein